MPENPTPAAKSDPVEPAEFNFSHATTEAPRIRRRSLKAKGLIKPSGTVPPTARELEREAPPLSAEEAEKTVSRPLEVKEKPVIRAEPAPKPVETPVAPPRTTPAVSAATTATAPSATASIATGPKAAVPSTGAASTPSSSATTASAPQKATPSSSSTATTSPHGTRPATLYYSSYPRKEKEASATTAPMKTIPTVSPAASPSPSATAQPSSTTRPATSSATAASTIPTSVTRPAAATSRPSTTSDYRANIERQSREQKSVGSLLSYVVYGLIAFFVLGAALAGYGGYVLSQRIHDQGLTVSDIDSRYAAANKDLNAKLATTQDTLSQAQAQISRQNDLIVKQQDDLNRLIAASNDLTKALASERQTRAQENASLRARVRDLEYEKPVTH